MVESEVSVAEIHPPPPSPINLVGESTFTTSHLELEPNTDPNVSTSNHATCYHCSGR